MTFSIIDSIGNTPLIEIKNINPVKGVKILAKLEYMNPGGSVKDRAALYMIEAAEKTGELTRDKTVIEATSGNTGIGLAMICAVKGYKLALTMAENASQERINILRARGAQIILTPKHLGSDGAIEEAYRLARENPDQYYITDQYNNDANWKAHYHTTGPEIIQQTNGDVSGVIATIGTSGTLMGLSRYLKEKDPNIQIICAEPYLGHQIQGLKNMKESYTPEIMDKKRLDDKINVDDDSAFKMARSLAKKEGLFVGMSSGAALVAAIEHAKQIQAAQNKDATIVVILPDSGERYLSTPLFSVKRNIALTVFNTLSKSKETFLPIEKDKVSVYTCGPTVSKRLNVGQFRRYAFTDLLIRYIEYHRLEVNHVVNVTDYDDTTLQGSLAAGMDHLSFTKKYFDWFKRDLEKLNIRPANAYPRVSEHLDQMIDLAGELRSKRHAYEKLHSLYFDISSLTDYGRLSNINLDKIKIGATVDLDEYEKKNPKDFTLLKRVKLSELKRGIGVKTPWGNVRPSLHLQCACLAMNYLGDTFDIHTGSKELIFPHHENEVAIARAARGSGFAKHWLHCAPVRYDGSLQADNINDLTLDTFLKEGFDFKTIRFWLISAHYRKPMVLTRQGLLQAKYTLDKMNQCIQTLGVVESGEPFKETDQLIYDIKNDFSNAMADDLKISSVISQLLANIKKINILINQHKIDQESAEKFIECFKDIDTVLKVFTFKKQPSYSEEIEELIQQRNEARQKKDFELADRIRDELIEKGIDIHDKKVT